MQMPRTLIKDLPLNGQKKTRICGWVESIRDQKRMQFLVIRDHTGKVQVAHDKEKNQELTHLISTLTCESVIEIIGQVALNPNVKLGGLEVIASSISILSKVQQHLPMTENPSLETRLEWRFLDLRQPRNYLIFQIQTAIEEAMRTFWLKEGFLEIHSPKLMAHASESGAELFEVKYFEGKAYLAQSPQFYKQMAMSAGFDRVFEIGPVFRANPSFTSRHDTEFTSVDMEMSWIDSHEDIMQFEEKWLQSVLLFIKKEFGEKIKENFDIDVIVPTIPFPRITMEEAYEILQTMDHHIERGEKGDLDPEGERLLYKYFHNKTGHEFVFVTHYPSAVRAFYHMRPEDNSKVTKSFDLLWKGLEITTGAQREHRYDILIQQAKEKGLSLEPIQYYLDFFKYGCPPHGGFGFGLTRMIMLLLGLKNVREVTYLYRGPHRLIP